MENKEKNNDHSPFRTIRERTMYLSILVDDLKIEIMRFETRGDIEKLKSNTAAIVEKIKKEVNEIRY